ncbi:esterase/lipase family protein [Uliginosibacterium sp. sgz301328]|uniref:esterase/lipase family protein n=1 Tax=Uliginosibacterium sp. sgz301328 TaxID=3243764 RepID=UPI00359F10A9
MTRFRQLAILLTTSLALSGCALFQVGTQQAKLSARCEIGGTVAVQLADKKAGNTRAPLIVALYRHVDGTPLERENWQVYDFSVLSRTNQWGFSAVAGDYAVVAVQDLNSNLSYDAGEPAYVPNAEQSVHCAGRGEEIVQNVVINGIPDVGEASVDFFSMRIGEDQQQLGQTFAAAPLTAGQITTLDDPNFSRTMATMGLWRPYDFIQRARMGIYFLQDYDPKKIPVLFVHGLSGTPTDFRNLIGNLDTKRFQPWVVFYPSGIPLGLLSRRLAELMHEVHLRYGFPEAMVVSHSMGTLVSRAMLMHLHAISDDFVPLFITVAGPWDGVASAALGVRDAPTPVWSWIDIAPRSDFLDSLFYRDDEAHTRVRLPPGVRHYLLFSYLPNQGGDGTIALTSQLRVEAQDDATALVGVEGSHVGVLSDPRTLTVVHKLLDDAATASAAHPERVAQQR